jgi:hypothetical protein
MAKLTKLEDIVSLCKRRRLNFGRARYMGAKGIKNETAELESGLDCDVDGDGCCGGRGEDIQG